MSVKNTYIQVTPSNVLSNGKVSYRNGNPVIRFEIGERDMHLIPNSIRLSGKLACFHNSNNDVSLNASNLNFSNKLGAMGVIEQIQFSSQRTKQTIEHIKHCDRLYSSLIGVRSSLQDYMDPYGNERLTVANKFLQKKAVSYPATKTNPLNFCIPLVSGFTMGSDLIPLSVNNGIGGLEITITLQPDSNFFFNNAATPETGQNTAFYELSDLELFAEGVVSADGSPLPVITQMEYNTISSYYETINSTNATINMPLSKRAVLGIFANFIPSNYLNNREFDGTQCRPPLNDNGDVAVINKLTFTRGGQRFPLEYNIDTIHRDQGVENCDSQILYNYVNGISEFSKLRRTLLNQQTTNTVNGATDKDVRQLGNLYGVGVSFTNISRDGVDFMNESLGINIDLDLTSDYPNSVYLFALNKEKIAFNNTQGIVVMN
jgi:hypothetical protein